MTIQQVADAYYLVVKNDRRSIDQIPSEHRAYVQAKLAEDQPKEPQEGGA